LNEICCRLSTRRQDVLKTNILNQYREMTFKNITARMTSTESYHKREKISRKQSYNDETC
jgi:hypothetical protein